MKNYHSSIWRWYQSYGTEILDIFSVRQKKKKSEKNTIVFQFEGTFNLGIILTESNYDVWSQLVEMHIAKWEKLSYIWGKTNPPKELEDGYEKWYAENQKVKR